MREYRYEHRHEIVGRVTRAGGSDIELVAADPLITAYDRMVAGDVKYRFVPRTGSLKEDS